MYLTLLHTYSTNEWKWKYSDLLWLANKFFSCRITESERCTTLGKPFACRSVPPGGRTSWIASGGQTWWVLIKSLLNRLMCVFLPLSLGLGSDVLENVINLCCFLQNLTKRLELAKPTPTLARSETMAFYQRQMVYAQLRLLPSMKRNQKAKTLLWSHVKPE